MTTSTRYNPHPPTNENNPPTKPHSTMVPPQPKRALGDITNLTTSQPPAPDHPYKQPVQQPKIRRAPTATTKPNSAAARRARMRARAALAAHRPKSSNNASPMSTSATARRRLPARLARHGATAPASEENLSCKLDFEDGVWPGTNGVLYDTVQLPSEVVDIDDADYGNELCNAQYAKDIFRSFRNVEGRFMPDKDYMTRQTDITVKMRAILVDWLVDVHLKFKLHPETLHLTVNIIDRFLDNKLVVRRKLQLVGVTAMFIASKYQEIYAPEVADFVYISDRAYSKDEILSMEAVILNELKFEVTVPSSLTFLRRAVKAARVETGLDGDVHANLAHYLVELSLQDSEMLRFRPSVRAATACLLSARLCFMPLYWSPTMTFCTGGWSEQDLAECEVEMRRLLEHERDLAGQNKLTAVKRKFGLPRFGGVSRSVEVAPVTLPTSMEICEE